MIKHYKIFKYKRKFKKLENYVLKKLAYHEAGHLIFSYLLDIQCEYILIDFSKIAPIELIDDNIVVEYESKSHVKHFLPQQMEIMLNNSRFGIEQLSQKYKLSLDSTWKIINQYVLILLAGYESQYFFTKTFINEELEDFERNFSQNLASLNPNEDINKMRLLLNNLTSEIDLKNSIVKNIKAIIREYLENNEIEKSIKLIAKTLLKKGKIEQREINEIIKDSGFQKFAELEIDNLKGKL